LSSTEEDAHDTHYLNSKTQRGVWMDEIHNKKGRLLAKYDRLTGIVELKEHTKVISLLLQPGQSLRIGDLKENSITILTRVGNTVFSDESH
jgi:hypothetical protein